EQQQLVQQILDNGFAYESNGSIYFDIEAYNKKFKYGILSGRSLENIKDESRELAGVGEKRNQADFALWKKAQPEHIMRWPSPWSDGFPGWHCECTAMGRKYLGEEFDIHGGGMDLVFPHHECEIAQAQASMGHQAVKYWMHNNMLTINGQKMGKSYNNFITLEQFFTGNHPLLEKAYSPMTIRFFVLSAHYRGTVDFSNEALVAAEKGLEKLLNAINDLERVQASAECDAETKNVVTELRQKCYDAMNDDFATPQVISYLFEACTTINKLVDHKATICADCVKELKEVMHLFAFEILGLAPNSKFGATVGGNSNDAREEAFGKVVDMVLELRAKAKADKDWATSDKIRDELAAAGFEVKDTKDGVTWKLNK
ncbi:MAG: cysteine--tRNA ligase, partial [Prevotella sp.]|nr:cysteine--tRNA ligase [Prevotella sp.]